LKNLHPNSKEIQKGHTRLKNIFLLKMSIRSMGKLLKYKDIYMRLFPIESDPIGFGKRQVCFTSTNYEQEELGWLNAKL